jgi:hypothetical protein
MIKRVFIPPIPQTQYRRYHLRAGLELALRLEDLALALQELAGALREALVDALDATLVATLDAALREALRHALDATLDHGLLGSLDEALFPIPVYLIRCNKRYKKGTMRGFQNFIRETASYAMTYAQNHSKIYAVASQLQ